MKRFTLTSIFCLCALLAMAQSLSVGQYNIRYDNSGDKKNGNGWEVRLPKIASLIHYEGWDVIGIQEALHHQYQGLKKELEGYGSVGVGRDDGKKKGEYAPIFYKKARILCHKHGTFWLSETPEVVGSKGWDASLPRICTWALLEDKTTHQRFWMFNLHMDHLGNTARTESARLVLRKIEEMCGDDPYILTGDFNVNQHSNEYSELVKSGKLRDAYDAAKYRMAENGTYNSFSAKSFTQNRIDHIFVSPQFHVQNFAILTYGYWVPDASGAKQNDSTCEMRVPSDHYPVSVKMEFLR